MRHQQQQALMAVNGAGNGMNGEQGSEIIRALADKLHCSAAAFFEVLASLLEGGKSAGWTGGFGRLELSGAVFRRNQPPRVAPRV
jgi:hypothetical protein